MTTCYRKLTHVICFMVSLCPAISSSAYDFTVDYGVGFYEFNSASPDVFAAKEIEPIIRQYYSLAGTALVNIYAYNQVSPGRYIVYSYIRGIASFTPLDSTATNRESPIVLALVDLNERSVIRLGRKRKPLRNLLSSFSASIEVYGCLQGYPVTFADVNGDGFVDLLFLGGGGDVYVDEMISAETELVLFLGPDFEEDPLEIKLHEEKFHFYFEQSGDKYQVARDQVGQRISGLEGESPFIRGTPANLRPGYRRFSKVYFGDFDGDGIHSVLVWRRFYVSRQKQDPVKGLEFESEAFGRYDFGIDSVTSVPLDNSQGHSILGSDQLEWRDGFPAIGKCYGREEGNRFILMDYGHPELSIDDPMLSR